VSRHDGGAGPGHDLAALLARALGEGPDADRALDELAARVLRDGPPWAAAPPELTGPEPALAEDDRRALDALGPDLVGRLLGQERRRRRARRARRRRGLTGSLHRAGAGGELSDEDREEMERKVCELEERERNVQGEERGDGREEEKPR
jgi:hypothetical protein